MEKGNNKREEFKEEKSTEEIDFGINSIYWYQKGAEDFCEEFKKYLMHKDRESMDNFQQIIMKNMLNSFSVKREKHNMVQALNNLKKHITKSHSK